MTRRAARVLAVGLLAALFGLGLLACGGGGGGEGGKVVVTLTDYDVVVRPASVPAGRVAFTITNRGGFVHEMLVVRSDLARAQLPTQANRMFDESGPGVRVISEAGDIAAGATASLDVELATGKYYLICNRPAEPGDPQSHFAHAMLSPFEVTT